MVDPIPPDWHRYEGSWRTGTGQVVRHVHSSYACEGRPCVVHNPSEHHMRAWPTHLRGGNVFDIGVFTERICPHGIGHPDPDDPHAPPSHGCDGCCALPINLDKDDNSDAVTSVSPEQGVGGKRLAAEHDLDAAFRIPESQLDAAVCPQHSEGNGTTTCTCGDPLLAAMHWKAEQDRLRATIKRWTHAACDSTVSDAAFEQACQALYKIAGEATVADVVTADDDAALIALAPEMAEAILAWEAGESAEGFTERMYLLVDKLRQIGAPA